MINHYAVLGVLPSASLEEVRASYRQLVKRFHPDVPGGNARFFARLSEAYEVLSRPEARRAYDAQRHHSPDARRAPPRDEARDRAPVAVLTRVMSITLPRSGRFQLQGLIGDIQVVPTTPEGLWDTTLAKYGGADRERLARHVIQIRLSGERELVRSLMPRPTDFGVEFERASPEEKRNRLRSFLESLLGRTPFGAGLGDGVRGMYGAHLPLTLMVTVPRGTSLFLRDITGGITVGNTDGEVVAKLLGGILRTGRIRRAHLTLNGGSRAFLGDVSGQVDLMGFGSSRTYVLGQLTRLRAVLENQSAAQVDGPVTELLAEVNDRAQLEVKGAVRTAHCDLTGTAQVRLTRVERLSGSRAPSSRLNAVLGRGQMPIAG